DRGRRAGLRGGGSQLPAAGGAGRHARTLQPGPRRDTRRTSGSYAMNEPVRLWDSPEAAAAWQRGASLRAASMRLPTEVMLDLAELEPGDRVLDVAAGSGEQSIAAAQRVGPNGSVLATDISGPMLELAAADAAAAGIRNFETLVTNAEDLKLPPVSFD